MTNEEAVEEVVGLIMGVVFGSPIIGLLIVFIKDAIKEATRYYVTIKLKCTDEENNIINSKFIILNAKEDKVLSECMIKPESDIALWKAVYEDRKLFDPKKLDHAITIDNNIMPAEYSINEYEIVKEYAVKRFTGRKYLYNLKYQLEASGFEVLIEKKDWYGNVKY